MSAHAYTEDPLIEQPAIGLFAELGWATATTAEELFGVPASGLTSSPWSGPVSLGRETKSEVVLLTRLKAALFRLNPTLPPEAMLGNDLVEVKTITPDKKTDTVQVKRAGDFVKLVVFKITDDFQFGARMVHRRNLKTGQGEFDEISWAATVAGEPDPEIHRNFPIKQVSTNT